MSESEARRSPDERSAALFLRLATRELEAPISRLKSRLLALAEESDPWKAREEIQDLSGSIHGLSRLIETLSDAADIEARRVRLKDEEIDLAHLFSERIGRRLWRFPAFRFLPETPARLEARGDRARLAFLIDDLLDAAIQAAPGGGIIHALLRRENGGVLLSACNRGAELPSSRFGSFIEWMAEAVERPGALRGIGIGLYRSYRTALLLNGSLEVAAPPEGGASFAVRFPLGEARPSPPDGNSPA